MKLIARSLALLGAILVTPAFAQSHRAGEFDYYVMALSWSAGWCKAEGDRRKDPQCTPGQGLTFVLHGLWPQYEQGYPSYCHSVARDPSRGETAAMADIMGSAGPAFYQWKKHGRCSGLSAQAYYALSRAAFARVELPAVFAGLRKQTSLPADVVEAAFLEANPQMRRDQVTVTCRDGQISEVRICLTKDLEPRRCGDDVIRDCRLKNAVMQPVR